MFQDVHVSYPPWFTIWSSLAHQGDVYSASFAAVPHIVAALATDPTRASGTYFQFPAWVEICRHRNGVVVPKHLILDYRRALHQLPALVAAAADRDWDSDFLPCALSAIAASKGFPTVAEAALELSPEISTEFMDWFSKR
ncbi:MAG TPA: hypothetical protein VN325_45810 [Steroidobacteraceae bacterium]|nr:hypothetical protein [Steroidobacteraceae bacterium]